MKKILIIFLIWLVVTNLFALTSLNRLNLKPDTAYGWIDPLKVPQVQEWSLINLHAKWDSFWHLDIAQNGYHFQGYDKLSNIVFFPLYALLIRSFGPLFGGNLILAGWLLSIIFLFGALVYLFKLIREFHPEIDPYLVLIFLLIFPTAFFLNAVYTESLFLFLSIASFYYGFKKDFVWAAVFGLLASLTRITGILLFIPLAWEYYQTFGWRFKLNIKLLSLFLIPLGTFGFFLFHFLKFGDLFLFFKIESKWGRSFFVGQDHFNFFSNPSIVNFALDIFFVGFAIICTYFIFKNLRTSYGLYMVATLFVALSTGTMMSIGRYIIVLFPLFILAASLKNQVAKMAWGFVSILLFALYTALFVNYYWAG